MLYTRPLVTPLTRPLIGKVLKQFDPLSNDPYLLFDAETSMLGELESPTLDLDASDPATLEVITATRSGVATFTDQAGVIQEAEPNTVRVDWSLGYPAMLIEPSAENLATDSSLFVELDDATRVGGIDAPDGSTNAKRISNAQAVSGNFAKNQTVSIPTGVAADYVGSVYVRGTAGETVNVFMKRASGGTFVTSGGRIVLLTGDWQRVENLALTSDPTNSNLSIYFSSAGETADTIDVWGAQIEEGTVSTSYIPTSGSAVTRNADQLSLSTSVTSSFFSSTGGGTFYAEFIPRDVLSDQWYLLSAQDYDRRFMYTNSGNARLNAYDGAGTRSYGQDMVANQLNRAAFTYTSTTQEASLDGAITEPVTHNGNYLTTSRLYLSSPANDKQMNGYLKRLLYWPTNSSNL